MIVLQLILYCLLFTAMVKIAVIGGAVNGLYFYPKAVQERAIELGISDRATIDRRFKCFMTAFYIVMLEVMNICDGVVIDKLWVGYSKFWVLPGLEDMPYVQTWRQVLKKRSMLALIWAAGAALVGSIVVLIF